MGARGRWAERGRDLDEPLDDVLQRHDADGLVEGVSRALRVHPLDDGQVALARLKVLEDPRELVVLEHLRREGALGGEAMARHTRRGKSGTPEGPGRRGPRGTPRSSSGRRTRTARPRRRDAVHRRGLALFARQAGHLQPPPPNRRTNRRTDFSAQRVPSALDLSPRPLTHLLMVAH